MAELKRKHAARFGFAPQGLLGTMVIAALFLSSCDTDNLGLLENYCVEGECTHPLDILNSIKLSRLNYVKQVDQKGCGAAALSSVLNYWDKPVSYESIVTKYPSAAAEGYSVGELKYIASKSGLIAYSLQMSEKTLKENLAKGRPIIIAVKDYLFKYINILPDFLPFKDQVTYSHYLVVFGYSDKGYWVMDPAEGYKYVSFDKLNIIWKRHNFVGLLVSSLPT